jgi:hypothetical protein
MANAVDIDVTNKCNKISQLIEHLTKIEKEYGDIDLCCSTQDGGLYDIHNFEIYYNGSNGKYEMIIS